MKKLLNALNFEDTLAGLVVFLIALPLCLGIALASGAPLFSGIIAGIVGGLLVSLFSGSELAVSGPAAGLTVIVLSGIEKLGSFEALLAALLIAGVLQLVLGFLNSGFISMYFPSSVIRGMLAAIGLILILKQIPHFLGVDSDSFGDMEFFQSDGFNTFSELFYSIYHVGLGPFIIGLISLGLLLLFSLPVLKKIKLFSFIPVPLIVIVVSIVVKNLFTDIARLTVSPAHLVKIPEITSFASLKTVLTFPDFSIFLKGNEVFIVAITIAIVASLETLLSIEATDKLDPHKRTSDTNRELKAQGLGNIVCSLIGGLPITAVIVRSSANIASGGKTRVSAFFHGIFLLLSILFIPNILNQIPLAALAAILLQVGYKLARPSLFKMSYKLGHEQFLPFIITIFAILLTDLLIGIGIGLSVGLFYILKANVEIPHSYQSIEDKKHHKVKLVLSEHVSFLNKAALLETLRNLPSNSEVEINGENSKYIAYDILELINDFKIRAEDNNIKLSLIAIPSLSSEQMSAH